MIDRDATAADLPAIDRVFRESFYDTFAHLYTPEDLAAFLARFTPEAWGEEFADPRYRFRVAEVDGQVVGYAKLGPSELPVETDKRAAELRQLYLLRKCHGQGVGKVLTDWAIDEARRLGAEELYLTVYVDNHRARRLYDRYGFEVVGQYDFMVGEQADEDIIMRKAL
jgi:ribosomal protein S18 acetylase RimI-like enzyme